MGERFGRGHRERKREVCDVEGEDVRPTCNEVQLLERVHCGRSVRWTCKSVRWGRRGSFWRVNGLHNCIAWTAEAVQVSFRCTE